MIELLPSNVVNDAMEEWCTGLERRLWAMQYSLLRQLDQHQVNLEVDKQSGFIQLTFAYRQRPDSLLPKQVGWMTFAQRLGGSFKKIIC